MQRRVATQLVSRTIDWRRVMPSDKMPSPPLLAENYVEVAPLVNLIKDIRARTDVLRGYL